MKSRIMEELKANRPQQQEPSKVHRQKSRDEQMRSEYLVCPIRHVISRFGDKWSLLVLFLLNRSETGVLRFSEIHRFMTDCSQKMLSQTLKNLERSHLVHREVFPEVPPRVEYSLTETGQSLMPVVMALVDWGQQHFGEVVTD